MGRYTGAVCRLCRREGEKLFLKGLRCNSEKCAIERRGYAPGMRGKARARTKVTPYGMQLREKQKIKRYYGLFEKQFRLTFQHAARSKGVTGEKLIQYLELRLDNITYRAGFAMSRSLARQMVRHGHVLVNNARIDVPSYRLKQGDVVSIAHHEVSKGIAKTGLEQTSYKKPVEWLLVEPEKLSATIVRIPGRTDIPETFNEQSVVELYSK